MGRDMAKGGETSLYEDKMGWGGRGGCVVGDGIDSKGGSVGKRKSTRIIDEDGPFGKNMGWGPGESTRDMFEFMGGGGASIE